LTNALFIPIEDLVAAYRRGVACVNGHRKKMGFMFEVLEPLAVLNERIGAIESFIKYLSAGDETAKWLSSLPGIGEFFSLQIRYDVDQMARFSSVKKFTSYTGLVPST
jgi:transposase